MFETGAIQASLTPILRDLAGIGFVPQRVFEQDAFAERMTRKDFPAITPLFTSNINLYGVFTVDFDKPSFLMAA